MNNAFFFQTQQIHDNSNLFDKLKQQKISFSYFQVDQNYYLFLYAQKSIQIDFLYQSIDVIQELDSKQRKIRSLRGFFLYALEIMETGKEYEILNTNLQPFFWRKVKTIIRQNQKGALLEFLFGKAELNQNQTLGLIPDLKDQIQTVQNQVNFLQDRINDLETKLTFEETSKYALSRTLEAPDTMKSIQHGDSTLKSEKGAYLSENDSKVNSELREVDKLDSNMLSEAPKSPFHTVSNIPSNKDKGLNGSNFITLGTITEQERIEIIKTGFQRQAEGRISFKKYYETTEQYSLFQFKGYNIKYESIRRTKLYQQLKV